MPSSAKTERSIGLHHGLVVLLCAAALAVSLRALAEWSIHRVALGVLYGPAAAWSLFLGEALAVALGAAALAVHVRDWRAGRWSALSLAPLRAFFSALVLGWIAFLVFVQPYERLHAVLWAGLCLGFASAVLLARRRSAWLREARSARAAEFLVFQLCLGLVLAEVVLTAAASVSTSTVFAQEVEDPPWGVRALRAAPGSLWLGFPYDSRGCYDEEPAPRRPDERLVAAIGDSFGVGAVPHAFHYTTVCERLLPETRVQNIGVNGIGIDGYRILLGSDALPLAPDLVVIALFVGNDLRRPLPARAGTWPLARWLDRRFVYVFTFTQRWLRMAAERASLERERGDEGRVQAADARGAEPSSASVTDPRELEQLFPWLVDPQLEEPTLSRPSWLDAERGRALRICAEDPELWQRFDEDMTALIDAARGVPLAVLVIPDELQVEDGLWRELFGANPADLERDLPQRRVAAWLDARGIPYVDLLPRLRALEPLADGVRHAYHRQDTHFNRRGNQVAGEGLAALVERVLGP